MHPAGFSKLLGWQSHSAVGSMLHRAGEVRHAQKGLLGIPACAGSCLGRAPLLSKSSGQWELMICFG